MQDIRDQRNVEGVQLLNPTPEQIREAWKTLARQIRLGNGGRFPNSERPDLENDDTAQPRAYINDNRWVADCLTPGCGGGMMVWRGNPRAVCLDCGTIWQPNFPPLALAANAIEILRLRPPGNRFWRPGLETLVDLRRENILHGYGIPPGDPVPPPLPSVEPPPYVPPPPVEEK